MPKYIKDKSGKFAGSIPEAPKLNSPSESTSPPVPEYTVHPSTPMSGPAVWQAQRDEQVRLQDEIYANRRLAADVVDNFTDKIIMEYPDSRYFVYDENWKPIAIEGYNNKVIIDLTSEEHASLAETIKIESSYVLPGLAKMKTEEHDYTSPEGYVGISMRIRCPDAIDCEFRRPARGFAPRHKASDYCMSGRRPHCTCDTCF
jgi:hypothetical protein